MNSSYMQCDTVPHNFKMLGRVNRRLTRFQTMFLNIAKNGEIMKDCFTETGSNSDRNRTLFNNVQYCIDMTYMFPFRFLGINMVWALRHTFATEMMCTS